MTASIDARIRRVCASMLHEIMSAHALTARQNHRDSADILQCLADEFHDLATAQAEATKSDQPATPAHRDHDGGLSAVIGPTRAGGPDHIGQAGERPATSSSPFDPFAALEAERAKVATLRAAAQKMANAWDVSTDAAYDAMADLLTALAETEPTP